MRAVDDAPVAVDDVLAVDEDSPGVIDVLANDTDHDGGPMRSATLGAPSHGTVTQLADGSVRYAPHA